MWFERNSPRRRNSCAELNLISMFAFGFSTFEFSRTSNLSGKEKMQLWRLTVCLLVAVLAAAANLQARTSTSPSAALQAPSTLPKSSTTNLRNMPANFSCWKMSEEEVPLEAESPGGHYIQ